MAGKMSFSKAIFGGAVLLSLLGASAVPARADDYRRYDREREKCERRIDKAEDKLQREIYRHGRFSPQAERRHRELWETRQQCRWIRNRDRDDWRNRYYERH